MDTDTHPHSYTRTKEASYPPFSVSPQINSMSQSSSLKPCPCVGAESPRGRRAAVGMQPGPGLPRPWQQPLSEHPGMHICLFTIQLLSQEEEAGWHWQSVRKHYPASLQIFFVFSILNINICESFHSYSKVTND